MFKVGDVVRYHVRSRSPKLKSFENYTITGISKNGMIRLKDAGPGFWKPHRFVFVCRAKRNHLPEWM